MDIFDKFAYDEQTVYINEKVKNYTKISNEVLLNKDISWKAKGILIYALGRPANWKFNLEYMAKNSTDGMTSLRSGIKELEELGYWLKYPIYDNGFISEYVTKVSETPFPENERVKNVKISDEDDIRVIEICLVNGEILKKIDNKNITLLEDLPLIEETPVLNGNLKTGMTGSQNLKTDNHTLPITDLTNDLSFSYNSIHQSIKDKEKMDGLIEKNRKYLITLRDKIGLDYFPTDIQLIVENSISYLLAQESITCRHGYHNNSMIRKYLFDLDTDAVDMAVRKFAVAENEGKVNYDRKKYFAMTLYNTILDKHIDSTYFGKYV